jgi:hypothetical protein
VADASSLDAVVAVEPVVVAGAPAVEVVEAVEAVDVVEAAVVTDVVDDVFGESEPQPASASAAVDNRERLIDRNGRRAMDDGSIRSPLARKVDRIPG